MQYTSQAWKTNQEQTLVSESFLEIIIKIGDTYAARQGTSTANGELYISNLEDVTNNTSAPHLYATFEKNMWILNGKYEIIWADTGIGDYTEDNTYPDEELFFPADSDEPFETNKRGFLESLIRPEALGA